MIEFNRYVPLGEVEERYGRDFVLLALIFNHPVAETLAGEEKSPRWRWKKNHLADDFILGERPDIRQPYNIDLNAMCAAHFSKKMFSLEEYMKFYMDINYSLCGFSEIFGQRCDEKGRDLIVQLIEHHEDVLVEKGENFQENYCWRKIDTYSNVCGMDIETEEQLGGYARLKPCPHLEKVLGYGNHHERA